MPDQYSVGFAHEHVVQPSRDPTFLFVETVFSHTLWNYGLPPVLPDWRRFNTVAGPNRKQTLAAEAVPTTLLPDSLTDRPVTEQSTARRFLRHIAYEVDVAQKALRDLVPRNSLVILMGDHQPPLLPTETFGVPVHILSTDPDLVEPFRQHGFTDGLRISPDAARWKHEGLFSLTVRSLADASRITPLPPLRPTGVPRSILAK
jgi:hypothetical protein